MDPRFFINQRTCLGMTWPSEHAMILSNHSGDMTYQQSQIHFGFCEKSTRRDCATATPRKKSIAATQL